MTAGNNKSMGALEWALLMILALIWGGAFFLSKVALAELPPFTIVLGRVGIAALALNLFLAITGRRVPHSFKTWGLFLIMGCLNNVIPFSLIVWGQTRIASSLTAILNGATPLWAVALAHVLTRDERLSFNRLGGVILGFLGVVIIIGPDALSGLGSNVAAQLAVVAAAFFYALAGVFGKRFKDIPPYATAAGQLTCSALLMIPITLWVDRPWTAPLPNLTTWGAIMGLALLCTALAYVIYFRILSTAGATNLMLVTFLIPVSSLLLGMNILGERLSPGVFAGMSFIGLGLALIDGRLGARAARRWKDALKGSRRELKSEIIIDKEITRHEIIG